MARLNLKTIFKKKSWTGEELGQLSLTTLCYEVMGRPTPLTLDEIRLIRKTLSDEEDQLYREYMTIHQWLSTMYYLSQTTYQQAMAQYYKLVAELTDIRRVNEMTETLRARPVEMTMEQYQSYKENRLQRVLGKQELSRIQLISIFASTHIRKAEKPAAFEALLKKYETETLDNPRILSIFNEKRGFGYYVLPDGRRNDEMSEDEWLAALKELRKPTEYELENPERQAGREDPIIRKAYRLWIGQKEEEKSPAVWRANPAPEKLTKADIILCKDALGTPVRLLDFYPELLDTTPKNPKEATQQLKEFFSDFGELAKLALEDMDSKYFGGNGSCSSAPVEEMNRAFITELDIYRMNFYGTGRTLLEHALTHKAFFGSSNISEAESFEKLECAAHGGSSLTGITNAGEDRADEVSERIKNYGIILTPHLVNPEYTLEYFDSLQKAFQWDGVRSFYPASPEYAPKTKSIADARNLMVLSFRISRGFSEIIDILIKRTNVPELAVLKPDIEEFIAKSDTLNDFIVYVNLAIHDNPTYSKEEQELNEAVMQDNFPLLHLSTEYLPIKSRVTEARKLLKDLTDFDVKARQLYELLMTF